ncbi:type II toxin-antitoxin system RelE/ParE family toxin [bacterium]|nr:MAG: type II toxin-antitoxin system RelE/ParE family toxin [bacterium]
MAKISWTREAEHWLREIYDYIAADNPEAAVNIVNMIYEKVQLLKEFPNMGFRYLPIKERNVRIILWGHYRIAYLVKENEDIDILGVFHGAMEVEKYLE